MAIEKVGIPLFLKGFRLCYAFQVLKTGLYISLCHCVRVLLGTGRDLLPCYCPNFRQAKSDAGLESRVDGLRAQVFYTTYFRSASAIKQLLFVKHRSDDLTLRFRKCNRLIIAERDHPVGFQKIDRISVICLEQLQVSAGIVLRGRKFRVSDCRIQRNQTFQRCQ